MGIEEKVRLAKKTKDEKLIEEIIKHYEPIFCEKISKTYGKEYKKEAKKMLPTLVYKYIYDDDIKSKLADVIRKKVPTFFPKNNYDEVIKNENSKYVKEHYVNKFYKELKILNTTNILKDDEFMMLSNEVINNFYNNYLNGDKKSSVSNYFNTQMNRKLMYFNDEEKLLSYYANKIALNNKIVSFFANKYKYLLKEFKHVDYKMYVNCIKNILCSDIYFQNFKFETKLIKEMENLEKNYKNHIKDCVLLIKNGDMTYYDEVKKYYSYIIDLVYEKYKDKVVISKNEFKRILNDKYEVVFEKTVNNMISNNEINIQKYINSNLTVYVKDTKYFYKKINDNKNKIIKDNEYLIDKIVKKYDEVINPSDVLEDIIIESYYNSAEEYFKKMGKRDFALYVDYKINSDVKKLDLNK